MTTADQLADLRALLDELEAAHNLVIRSEDQDWQRLIVEHDAIPDLVARLRAVADLADELDGAHRPIRHPGRHPIAARIRAALGGAR